MKIDKLLTRYERHINLVVEQANIPDSRVSHLLSLYQAPDRIPYPPSLKNTLPADLKSILAVGTFLVSYGIHPDTIIDLQKRTTTPPEQTQ
jgi:hypothetical protein